MNRMTLPRYFGHSMNPFFISYESISEVKDYYPCTAYPEAGILHMIPKICFLEILLKNIVNRCEKL